MFLKCWLFDSKWSIKESASFYMINWSPSDDNIVLIKLSFQQVYLQLNPNEVGEM